MVRNVKLTRDGKTVTCSKCKNKGHNQRQCKGQNKSQSQGQPSQSKGGLKRKNEAGGVGGSRKAAAASQCGPS